MKTIAPVLLMITVCNACWAGEPIPEFAKIETPAEYDLLSYKLTAEQFAEFKARADKGEALALDLVFYAYYRGFGTKASFPKAREYQARAFKAGGPLAAHYEGRNRMGFPLNPPKGMPDKVASQILYKKSLAFFMPLAEAGSPMAMNMAAMCRGEINREAKEWSEEESRQVRMLYEKAVAAGNICAVYNLGLFHGDGSNETSAALLMRAAEAGIPAAKTRLVRRFAESRAHPGDPVLMARFGREAADSGDPHAIQALATIYMLGLGLPRDAAKAVQLIGSMPNPGFMEYSKLGIGAENARDFPAARIAYEKGAEKKEQYAMYALGNLLTLGRGGPADPDRAFKLIKAAAEGGFLKAYDSLVWHYQIGRGTPQDPDEAFRWLIKGTKFEKGLTRFRLGLAYLKGNGTPRDAKKGLELLNQAALNGEGVELGKLYAQGVDGLPRNMEKAAEWFKKEADSEVQMGDEGCYRYALCLRDGEGVPKNMAAFVKYLTHAASNPWHAEANNELGTIYYNGFGVPVNYAEALNYFQRAANEDHPQALRNLSIMYREGKGVAKDIAKADKHLQRAEQEAKQQLDEKLFMTEPSPFKEKDLDF